MRAILAAAAALLLGACGPAVSPETEPNDHFTQANPLGAGAKGKVATAGDIDVYKLSVTRDDAVFSLHVGGIRDVDFVISVQDKERQELKRYDETTLGGDEQALDLGLAAGDYYVVLSNNNAKASNPEQEYELKAKLETGDGREREPNDRPLLANKLSPGGVTRGHYYPTQNLLSEAEDKAEEDWYRVKVEQEGQFVLNLDLSEVPKIDPVLEIYDANGYKLKEIDAGGPGEPEALKRFGVKGPAEFLLRLRTKPARSGAADVGYELLTELLPYDGKTEFEPNDQRLDATPAGAVISGQIGTAGDSDWYQLVVAEEGRKVLRADLSALAGADLTLTVADELGNPIVSVDGMGKELPEILTGLGVGQGTYYLIIGEKTGRFADPRREYTLSRSLDPWQEGLEYEMSLSSRAPQAVKLGESVDGYLAPKGDVDWYEFNVYQKGRVVVELTGVLNVRWGATLYDQDSRVLHDASAKKAGDPISFDQELEPGTYWLKLRAEEPGQDNVRDKYTLRLRIM